MGAKTAQPRPAAEMTSPALTESAKDCAVVIFDEANAVAVRTSMLALVRPSELAAGSSLPYPPWMGGRSCALAAGAPNFLGLARQIRSRSATSCSRD